MSKAKKSKRFTYSLQTLLKVREIREKQEQDKFIAAEKKLLEEIEKEKKAKEAVAAAYTELSEMMVSKEMPDMNVIKLHKLNLDTLEEKLKAQIEAVKKAEQAVEDQREKLTQAMKERKIIEKDREKTRIAWKKIMDKEDAKFLDELNSIKSAKDMNPDIV